VDEWRINAGLGLGVGIGLMAVIFLVDAALVWLAIDRQTVSIGTFAIGLAVAVSLAALALLGHWTYGLADSGYFLDRNALIIHWGSAEQIIPVGQIERVVSGAEVEGRVQFSGGRWPGHFVGYGELAGVGPTLFYAAASLRRQILVVTPGLAYGISPADQGEFLKALRRRIEMGPTQVVDQSSVRPGFLSWPIWKDRVGLALVGGSFAVVLVLTGLLCYYYPSLPRLIPLHFDVTGMPDRLDSRGHIFIIPLIGFLASLVNGVLGWMTNRRDRVVSYLVWGGALLVEALVWGAALGILTQL
jgi:hypothetical protein